MDRFYSKLVHTLAATDSWETNRVFKSLTDLEFKLPPLKNPCRFGALDTRPSNCRCLRRGGNTDPRYDAYFKQVWFPVDTFGCAPCGAHQGVHPTGPFDLSTLAILTFECIQNAAIQHQDTIAQDLAYGMRCVFLATYIDTEYEKVCPELTCTCSGVACARGLHFELLHGTTNLNPHIQKSTLAKDGTREDASFRQALSTFSQDVIRVKTRYDMFFTEKKFWNYAINTLYPKLRSLTPDERTQFEELTQKIGPCHLHGSSARSMLLHDSDLDVMAEVSIPHIHDSLEGSYIVGSERAPRVQMGNFDISSKSNIDFRSPPSGMLDAAVQHMYQNNVRLSNFIYFITSALRELCARDAQVDHKGIPTITIQIIALASNGDVNKVMQLLSTPHSIRVCKDNTLCVNPSPKYNVYHEQHPDWNLALNFTPVHMAIFPKVLTARLNYMTFIVAAKSQGPRAMLPPISRTPDFCKAVQQYHGML